jgi:protein-L-isoaspartate O-methyltransferase
MNGGDDPRARIVLALRKAGVTDSAVLQAIETVPREVFMSTGFEGRAWAVQHLPTRGPSNVVKQSASLMSSAS